jgi:hypothetical protein
MSLRSRALLAVALTIGFYVLALALIAGLIWVVFIPDVPGRVIGFCVIGAILIAVSIVPGRTDSVRPDRFSTPPANRGCSPPWMTWPGPSASQCLRRSTSLLR